MASRLLHSSLERVVRIPAMAMGALSARHFTLTVPLSTKMYKWVPVNLMLGPGTEREGGGGGRFNPAMV